jgi:hypothetical protein
MNTAQGLSDVLADLESLGDHPVAERITVLERVCARLEFTLLGARD